MPFSNPIVAGNTLVRDAIQSEGFLTGVTGWSIQRDGDAEFNDVAIRGTVEISGANGTLTLDVDILGNPQIEFTVANGDQYQIVADDTSLDIGALDNFAGDSSIHIVDDLGIVLRSALTGAPSILFDYNTGYLRYGNYAPWTEETWHAVAFVNAFANLASYETVGYKKTIDGKVALKGSCVRNALTGNDLVIFTLPAAYRPVARRAIPVASLSNGVNVDQAVIRIYEIGHASAGAVALWGFAAANPTAISFDGCEFNLI